MVTKLATARIELIKLGKQYPHGIITRPHCKQAFIMIAEIAKAFTPETVRSCTNIYAARDYVISKNSNGINPELAVINERINGQKPLYWMADGKHYPESGTLPPEMTQLIAKDIAAHWLLEMLKKLSTERGRKTAIAFSAELKIISDTWIPRSSR